ncbi:MAG: hypothetical protein A2937_01470 [Candidatus Yonathbacteria bacterium RIFCSPLOWO2_01_FULL_47_33b]|uniref:Uncharacterized protein n=1 Tax=Candidatus Yonathbacteria bacterium RIFCSPLOWO2_01_FULL_47_33b TaxID=1802727 RepID=A0A1G2SHB5_9BACT|nr:MAG: hypothetical protein A2937_01470 [Candidatus Yonathbacteria bacterium RIFCSPLOWO2_01_FULL_47_33b]
MLQVILVIFGILILIKGKLKVSDTKVISRPQSTYWGLVVLAYAVGLNFVPETLVYGIVFWISLLVVSITFVVKGETIAGVDITTKPTETKRNAMILLGFVVVLVVLFVYVWKF